METTDEQRLNWLTEDSHQRKSSLLAEPVYNSAFYLVFLFQKQGTDK